MRSHLSGVELRLPRSGLVALRLPEAEKPLRGCLREPGIVGLQLVARPFREPGVEVPDPLPAGSPCCVPRFDANPERLRVDSDGLIGATALEVTSGAVVTNLTGPLDYAFRTYTILPDPGTPPSVSGNISAIPVPVPATNEFTVASFNMERFFDTVDDPGISDVALTVTAFNNRLNKASLAIRNVMRTPDIIGVEEMENLTTLQAVAMKINSDAVAASEPNPNYQAYLVEGNDIGGIDVGFLVRASRVTVIDVTQFGKATTYTEPGGATALLNDRPPLVLRATITAPDTSLFPITVVVNHLRSLSGVDDPVDGNRVRTKRRAQAEYLANLIQTRQTADPNEHIISVGDYNAFEFNDGYVDVVGTIKGSPTAANQVVLASSDLVNPDLTDLIDFASADQKYSYSFDGNAQALDHELVNANLLARLSHVNYARNDADFPESFRNDPNRPERISDHDMAVAYFTFPHVCSITCPQNKTQSNLKGQCGAFVSYPSPTVSNTCFHVGCSPDSDSFFPVGTTTVTCAESIDGGPSCTFRK
jgi:predicted extracellular nuclease